MKFLIKEKLELLLQSKWTEFIDRQQLMRLSLEYVRDTEYRKLKQKEIPTVQIRLTVTKFAIIPNPSEFELWIEFSIPKEDGVVIVTHVVSLNFAGEVKLKETHGTHFLIETT